MVYVWAFEQKRGKAKSTYLKQKRSNRKEENAMLPEEAGGTTEEEKDKNREANIVRSGLFPQNNILVHEKAVGGIVASMAL